MRFAWSNSCRTLHRLVGALRDLPAAAHLYMRYMLPALFAAALSMWLAIPGPATMASASLIGSDALAHSVRMRHISGSLAKSPHARGRLQKVQLDLSPAPRQLLGAYSHRHSVSARVRALLEFIQARLQGGDHVPVRPSRL